MSILRTLQGRVHRALAQLPDARLAPEELAELASQVRASQDPKFGDYQANLAMPLGKRLGKPPREVAQSLVGLLEVADLTDPPEIAGPGFINFRVRDEWISRSMAALAQDDRLGVAPAERPQVYVIDYSSPNVAKPMHVGHIRSTVIGDCLYRVLKFLGHQVVGDNHLGDWGTQFGMIIHGFRHFLNEAAYQSSPVDELARLYKIVSRLVDYRELQSQRPALAQKVSAASAAWERARDAAARLASNDPAKKQAVKDEKRFAESLAKIREEQRSAEASLAAVETDPTIAELLSRPESIGEEVLEETAKLHAGDPENTRLWREFMPPCLSALEAVYRRLGVTFDETLGESFYHDRLAGVVDDLLARGIARESEGAICVFLEEGAPPLIVRKKDGAFLYATSDLATIRYRLERWRPAAILYVVDHRQSLHFEGLFAAARRWGIDSVLLAHVSFGTVLGEDNRPYKTRSGDTVGLTGLLDEAVERAYAVVRENDDAKPDGPELDESQRRRVAETVGISALKYADLSQNRTSDYVFSYDKMLAMRGNTATYMQYAYARVRSIFRKGKEDAAEIRRAAHPPGVAAPAERALALAILRFEDALAEVVADWRPNMLTNYLFDLANRYSTFFEQCHVLRAETPELRRDRLLLCDLTARVLEKGLSLLGIPVVEQM